MNKAQEEGSISIGYIMDEAAKFASFYFKEGDPTLPLKEKRNEVYLDDMFEIFKPPGKAIGAEGKRYLADNEYTTAHLYVLMNCPEVQPFIE